MIAKKKAAESKKPPRRGGRTRLKTTKLAEAEESMLLKQEFARGSNKIKRPTTAAMTKQKRKRSRREGELDRCIRIFGGSNSREGLVAAIRAGLLSLIPVASIPVCPSEDELLAYPSVHTCMVCNVVAITDLLRQGSSSRFVTHGIPPVYLACALDMDRDDVDGTIHTLGPATLGFQGLCEQEAMKFPEVRRGEAGS